MVLAGSRSHCGDERHCQDVERANLSEKHKACQRLFRYEELKHQLEIAQEAAHEEDEEAELARATAAVARLTAPAAINDADIRLAEELTDVASNNANTRRSPKPRVGLPPDVSSMPRSDGGSFAVFALKWGMPQA